MKARSFTATFFLVGFWHEKAHRKTKGANQQIQGQIIRNSID
jgi:hypothetical protein